ncbi:hypothetical protein EJB05_05777, partial [Eragrostis curvula]
MARRIPSRRARCQLEHAFHEHRSLGTHFCRPSTSSPPALHAEVAGHLLGGLHPAVRLPPCGLRGKDKKFA